MSTKRLLILGIGALIIVAGTFALLVLPAKAPTPSYVTAVDTHVTQETSTTSTDTIPTTKATSTPTEPQPKGSTTTDGGLSATVKGKTVTLTAPADVMQKFTSCTYAFGFSGASGNGLTVNWGDGTTEPGASFGVTPMEQDKHRGTSCTDVVSTHTYAAPGEYTISVRSWHPGPTDMAITDWSGEATVVVR